MLEESLEAGSIGLSIGLLYCPGCFSRTEEITELASVLTEYGAPLVTHTRGMSEIYDEAVKEVIQVAEGNRIPLHLSHHFGGFETGKLIDPTQLKTKLSFLLAKVMGESFTVKNQFKAMPSHLRANQADRTRPLGRGVEVGHDMLPWICAFTSLLAILPPRLYTGGMAKLLEQLRDPEVRKAVIKEMETALPKWPTWEHGWWTDNMFDGSFMLGGFKLEKNRPYENMRLHDIAKERGTDLYNTAFDLIVEEEGRIFFVYSIDDQTISDWIGAWAISDPNCAIMTDIVGVDYPNPAPVSYGAFTKVLGQFARDKGIHDPGRGGPQDDFPPGKADATQGPRNHQEGRLCGHHRLQPQDREELRLLQGPPPVLGRNRIRPDQRQACPRKRHATMPRPSQAR